MCHRDSPLGARPLATAAGSWRETLRPAGDDSDTASPAVSAPLAQVDDRLNGDGAGIAFGVNDPVLGAHLLGVFTTIWALYYVSTQSEVFVKRGGKNDDSGLSL